MYLCRPAEDPNSSLCSGWSLTLKQIHLVKVLIKNAIKIFIGINVVSDMIYNTQIGTLVLFVWYKITSHLLSDTVQSFLLVFWCFLCKHQSWIEITKTTTSFGYIKDIISFSSCFFLLHILVQFSRLYFCFQGFNTNFHITVLDVKILETWKV